MFLGQLSMSSPFLSTLSLRRATSPCAFRSSKSFYFYPRSPCGERPPAVEAAQDKALISIHALLAESDVIFAPLVKLCAISIHALLAESDAVACGCMMDAVLFLSTLSLRRATCWWVWALVAWIFLSTLSLRRATCRHPILSQPGQGFLSTLSLRRATGH